MTHITWRDLYDEEGLAEGLATLSNRLALRGHYVDAATLRAAAACISEQAERIAELEAATPAPEGGEALREAAERMVNDLDRARRIGPMPSSAMLRVWASRLRKALTQNGGGEG